MSHEGVLKVLISDKMDSRCVEILEANAGITAEVDTGLSPHALQQRIGDYDGLIVRSSTKVTAEVLSAAPKLKVIGRAGTGFPPTGEAPFDVTGAAIKGPRPQRCARGSFSRAARRWRE